MRETTIAYGDGVGSPTGEGEPSARQISNVIFAQDHHVPCAADVSDYIWQWGQFIDHDIDLTPAVSPVELFNVAVPTGDPYFDPDGTGTQVIELDRSLYPDDQRYSPAAEHRHRFHRRLAGLRLG